MNHIIKNKSGFTIIELTLAMSFVAVLLLIITTTTLQVANIYNKGVTIKQINQSGRYLSDEVVRVVNSATPFDLTSDHLVNTSSGGRLCTGDYSFIWNYGDALNIINNTQTNKYTNPNTSTAIKFVKVYDPNSDYCIRYSTSALLIDFSKSVELLDSNQYEIVTHGFNISSDASVYDPITSQRLYSINFTIGTNESGTLSTSSPIGSDLNKSCLAPTALTSNFTYCATGQFNVLARAGDTIE